MALLASLATLAYPADAQPAVTSASRPLTVTVGPRDGVWKRVFNPLLVHADTRWPASAGIYEPLIVYNRATASYLPGRARPYAGASPGQPDSLPALVEVAPR